MTYPKSPSGRSPSRRMDCGVHPHGQGPFGARGGAMAKCHYELGVGTTMTGKAVPHQITLTHSCIYVHAAPSPTHLQARPHLSNLHTNTHTHMLRRAFTHPLTHPALRHTHVCTQIYIGPTAPHMPPRICSHTFTPRSHPIPRSHSHSMELPEASSESEPPSAHGPGAPST